MGSTFPKVGFVKGRLANISFYVSMSVFYFKPTMRPHAQNRLLLWLCFMIYLYSVLCCTSLSVNWFSPIIIQKKWQISLLLQDLFLYVLHSLYSLICRMFTCPSLRGQYPKRKVSVYIKYVCKLFTYSDKRRDNTETEDFHEHWQLSAV